MLVLDHHHHHPKTCRLFCSLPVYIMCIKGKPCFIAQPYRARCGKIYLCSIPAFSLILVIFCFMQPICAFADSAKFPFKFHASTEMDFLLSLEKRTCSPLRGNSYVLHSLITRPSMMFIARWPSKKSRVQFSTQVTRELSVSSCVSL